MSAVFALADWGGGLASASSMAPRVDAVFRYLVLVSAAVVALLLTLNLTFLIRYRRGSTAPRGPLRVPVSVIEGSWIAATTLVFLSFFGWGASIYLDQMRTPAASVRLQVTARQWMWDVRHENGRRELDTLHVPVGEVVRLDLSSEDVIHSLFVPAFRVKQDVLPGRTVSAWFEATRPGRYRLYCTQYCGTKHAAMTGEVVALPAAEYADWLNRGNVDAEVVHRGRDAFVRYGCAGCHTAGSTVRAPSLTGLFNQRVPLADGGFVRADEVYLRDSILEPNKQVAAGFAPVMPSFKGVIGEGDLADLIAYLRTLRAESAAGDRL